jgi:hypothetical protein
MSNQEPDQVPEPTVREKDACPVCGERSMDELIWRDDEYVHCQRCEAFYMPPTVRAEGPPAVRRNQSRWKKIREWLMANAGTWELVPLRDGEHAESVRRSFALCAKRFGKFETRVSDGKVYARYLGTEAQP